MSSSPSIEETARGLHSSAIHLLRRVRTEDQALGVAPGQLSALSVVVFAGPISLNDLARTELVKPPTMSRIVDALVREGLVKREVNKTDRRAIVISATSKGTSLMHEGRSRREQALVALLKPLKKTDLESLEKAVQIIQKIL
ncbi:MAG TPA: MarR family transcriptional regulator [Candidatus Binatus sp.]|nr:MarR family transcriptional regulator [Candidatus Binatus sp.]